MSTTANPKGYRKSVRFLDEETKEALFVGDIIGHVAKSNVEIFDYNGRLAFSMKPNRIFVPTRWTLRTGDGAVVGTLVQKIFRRGFWVGLDAAGLERFRAIDPQSRRDQLAMQALGGAVSRNALVAGETLIGSVQEEKREKVKKKGIFGFLKRLVVSSDPVLRLELAAVDVDPRLFCGFLLVLYEITVPLDRSL